MNAKTAASLRGRYHAIIAELCRQFELSKTSETRHQLTEWILGYSKSSSQFTAKEYCLIIDQVVEWIKGDVEPHPLSKTEQARLSHDERQKQLVHAISQLAPEQYIQAVCNDRHSQRPWRDLTAFQLTRLRYTIASRAAAAHKKGKPLA
jgi:hypothetical protein